MNYLSINELQLTILIPAYNEATRIENCVKLVERSAESFTASYEIIIAEDGSTDGTNVIASRLARDNPRIINLHSPIRLGKGQAIKRALQIASGDVVVFLDADLATNLDCLPRIVNTARMRRGIVVGSRYSSGSMVRRPVSRKLFSITYNVLVRTLFHDGVHDHQCGFKALSCELVNVLKDMIESDGFFVDTEILVRAKGLGSPITEVAVEWTETRKKGESKVRVFRDALKMGIALLKLRLRSNISARVVKEERTMQHVKMAKHLR